MPISNLALLAGRGTVSISFGDDTLNVVYDPNRVNAANEERFALMRLRGRAITAQAQYLLAAIIEWDVMLDGELIMPGDLVVSEGESLARYDPEIHQRDEARPFIETLPQLALGAITDAINDHLGKTRMTGVRSAAGALKNNGRT